MLHCLLLAFRTCGTAYHVVNTHNKRHHYYFLASVRFVEGGSDLLFGVQDEAADEVEVFWSLLSGSCESLKHAVCFDRAVAGVTASPAE